MSLNLEMRRAARLAPQVLGDSAALVRRFLGSQQNEDGGFKDRAGASDLYYTVFGIAALDALGESPDAGRLERHLAGFGGGTGLDLVHVASLARCWSALPPAALPTSARASILKHLESFRTADGGYGPGGAAPHGTVYACFLAWGAHEDLGSRVPRGETLVSCLDALRSDDCAYANEPGLPAGTTPATAAAALLLRRMELPVPAEIAPWLLARCRPEGGFTASPATPMPDLLSTATALHALAGLGVALDGIRDPCLDFIDTLWSNQGGFHGHWADDALDCEYTSYGLLAIGHLAA